MIKALAGSDFDRVLLAILPFLSKIKIRPDTLTLVGVFVATLSGTAFALGQPVWGGTLLLASGFFDLIDGVVARQQGSSSKSGAFFDSSMDRLADLVVFSGIAVGMATQAQPWGVALLCWALTASVMTSYTRARAERDLAHFDVGIMERGERVVVLVLGAATGLLVPALWVIAIGGSVTTVQRLVAARRLLLELESSGVDPTRSAATAETSQAPAADAPDAPEGDSGVGHAREA